jgi:hypothetical protein
MTLWDQLDGRTWNERADPQQADGTGRARRRQVRRRKLTQPRRQSRGAPRVRD